MNGWMDGWMDGWKVGRIPRGSVNLHYSSVYIARLVLIRLHSTDVLKHLIVPKALVFNSSVAQPGMT